jgi:hypothetical protein
VKAAIPASLIVLFLAAQFPAFPFPTGVAMRFTSFAATIFRSSARVSIIALALAIPTAARAQALYGTLTGNVTDSSGAVVAGATGAITHKETGQSRDGVTDANGSYDFPTVQAGTYSIKVGKSGFKTVTKEGVGRGSSYFDPFAFKPVSGARFGAAGWNLLRAQAPTTGTSGSSASSGSPRESTSSSAPKRLTSQTRHISPIRAATYRTYSSTRTARSVRSTGSPRSPARTPTSLNVNSDSG